MMSRWLLILMTWTMCHRQCCMLVSIAIPRPWNPALHQAKVNPDIFKLCTRDIFWAPFCLERESHSLSSCSLFPLGIVEVDDIDGWVGGFVFLVVTPTTNTYILSGGNTSKSTFILLLHQSRNSMFSLITYFFLSPNSINVFVGVLGTVCQRPRYFRTSQCTSGTCHVPAY